MDCRLNYFAIIPTLFPCVLLFHYPYMLLATFFLAAGVLKICPHSLCSLAEESLTRASVQTPSQ